MILNRSAASLQAELNAVRTEAIAQINTAIGEVRRLFITDIPAQQMIYLAKEREATAYLSEPSAPNMVDYPFIEREMAATNMSGHEVAQVFLNMAAMWRPIGADLEALRIGYSAQVSTATTAPQIAALLGELTATLEAYRE